MRLPLLTAAAALCLSACGNNDQRDNNQNIDENLTAENIVSNDVTAIDAVTGDAANMAADVNYSVDENALGNEANDVATTPSTKAVPRPRPRTETPRATKPVASPVANTATNAE